MISPISSMGCAVAGPLTSQSAHGMFRVHVEEACIPAPVLGIKTLKWVSDMVLYAAGFGGHGVLKKVAGL